MFTKLKSKFSEIVVVLASVATFFIGVALIDRIFTSNYNTGVVFDIITYGLMLQTQYQMALIFQKLSLNFSTYYAIPFVNYFFNFIQKSQQSFPLPNVLVRSHIKFLCRPSYTVSSLSQKH